MPITDALALAMLRSSPPKRGQWVHEIKYDPVIALSPMWRTPGPSPDPARYDWSARLGNLRVPVASLTARVTGAPHVKEIALFHRCHFVAPLAFAGCEALA
jgi:hypothetical protein